MCCMLVLEHCQFAKIVTQVALVGALWKLVESPGASESHLFCAALVLFVQFAPQFQAILIFTPTICSRRS